MTARRAFPQSFQISAPTLWIDSGAVAASAGWSLNGGPTVTQDTTRTRLLSSTCKWDPGANADTKIYKDVTAFSLKSGLIRVVCYCQNLNSNTLLQILLSNDTGFAANTRQYYWSAANVLREGWNHLTVHLDEAGPTSYDGARTWTTSGTGFDYKTQTLRSIRLQIQNAGTPNFPMVWVEGIYLNGTSSPILMFGTDAATKVNLDVLQPALDALGVKGYVSLTYDPAGVNLTALNAWYAAGHDILNHVYDHTSLSGKTQAEVEALLKQETAILVRNGWTRGLDQWVSPNNYFSAETVAASQALGYVRCRNGVNASKNSALVLTGMDNPHRMGAQTCDQLTLTQWKNRTVDAAILYGATIDAYGHDFVAGGDGIAASPAGQMYINDFNSWLAYAQSKRKLGLLEIMSPTQWYSGLSGVRRPY